MPRHVLNRGVGRQTLFHKEVDDAAFEHVMPGTRKGDAHLFRQTPKRAGAEKGSGEPQKGMDVESSRLGNDDAR